SASSIKRNSRCCPTRRAPSPGRASRWASWGCGSSPCRAVSASPSPSRWGRCSATPPSGCRAGCGAAPRPCEAMEWPAPGRGRRFTAGGRVGEIPRGAMAMIVSAPFDNWWHNAYGLDVKVLSPPHVILALGFTGIELGAVLMVAAMQNRAGSEARRGYGLLLAYGFGILVLNVAIMGFEQIAFPQDAHNALYYLVCGAIFPIL